jgi:hypothetical protein
MNLGIILRWDICFKYTIVNYLTNSTLALYTLFYAAHKRRTKKRTKWVDLIFEVEKFSIFQLQKLNQPEKKTSKARMRVKCQSRTKQ